MASVCGIFAMAINVSLPLLSVLRMALYVCHTELPAGVICHHRSLPQGSFSEQQYGHLSQVENSCPPYVPAGRWGFKDL